MYQHTILFIHSNHSLYIIIIIIMIKGSIYVSVFVVTRLLVALLGNFVTGVAPHGEMLSVVLHHHLRDLGRDDMQTH